MGMCKCILAETSRGRPAAGSRFHNARTRKRKEKMMKTHSTRWIVPIIFCGLLFIPWPTIDEAHGQRRYEGSPRDERVYRPPSQGQRGSAVHQPRHGPPRGYHPAHRRDYRAPYGEPSYTHRGPTHTYRGPAPRHRPRLPVGSVVPRLPPGHRRILYQNHIYYEFSGNYYRRSPWGYVVISIPFFLR